MAGRPTRKRTCALPVSVRAMPENEIPPAMRVDIYFLLHIMFGSSFGRKSDKIARNTYKEVLYRGRSGKWRKVCFRSEQ